MVAPKTPTAPENDTLAGALNRTLPPVDTVQGDNVPTTKEVTQTAMNALMDYFASEQEQAKPSDPSVPSEHRSGGTSTGSAK